MNELYTNGTVRSFRNNIRKVSSSVYSLVFPYATACANYELL